MERAGIIERSISPWASPVVIVPKKSAPGEPPRRRMCVDYRKINKLQPEVTKADSRKGCISLIPLPKIDELYAKLKGYKVFSGLDLRSGYYHIGLKDSAKPKEVKQFLGLVGLVGYYRKFVPRFADISRVLTHLTKKDVEFKWTPECENCFKILKEFLQQVPIL